MASCVCRSWSVVMSSDHVWQDICTTHYPSLSTLKISHPSLPYRRLYAIGCAAAIRRLKPPPKPRISLDNLIFTIDLHTKKLNRPIITILKPCKELEPDKNAVFRFNIDVNCESLTVADVLREVKITWNVVLEGWRAIFNMMDCDGKLSITGGGEGCFSEELPSLGCCGGGISSGIVADFKLGFCNGGGRVEVENVIVGMMSVVSWRYLSVDDGLRYLQHFLVPCYL